MRLADLNLRNGEVLIKDGEFQCFGLLSYDAPGQMLSFFGNKSFESHLSNKKISCVICKKELLVYIPDHVQGIIISDNPLFSFWDLHERYGKTDKYNFPSIIGENCNISKLASIDKCGVIIGDNVTIEEFAAIKAGTKIGNNGIIRAGSVLGGECLELSRKGDRLNLASLYGGIIIEDNVYIGYNNTLVKGTFEWENSRIGESTKIDSNNYISHNVKIGRRGVITSGVIINGDVIIGDDVWMSPGVNITNSISIGESVSIMLGAKVQKRITDNKVFVGEKEYDKRLLDAVKKKD